MKSLKNELYNTMEQNQMKSVIGGATDSAFVNFTGSGSMTKPGGEVISYSADEVYTTGTRYCNQGDC